MPVPTSESSDDGEHRRNPNREAKRGTIRVAGPITTGDLDDAVSGDDLKRWIGATADSSLAPNQRLVLALAAHFHAVAAEARLVRDLLGANGSNLIAAVFFFVIFYGSMTIASWVLGNFGVLAIGVLFLLVALLLGRMHDDFQDVKFKLDKNGRIQILNFGRLYAYRYENPLGVGIVLLMMVMTTQIQMIRLFDHHLGFGDVDGFKQALSITWSGVVDVGTLGILEFIGLHEPALPIHPSFGEKLILFALRLAAAGSMGYAVYGLSMARRLNRIYADFPKSVEGEPCSIDAITDWMESLSRDPENWGRKFHDEMITNMLIEEYIRGRFDVVREVARQFPSIRLSDDVRAFIVDPSNGAALMEPRPKRVTSRAKTTSTLS